ncbi:MAG: diaminopimelate epimerase [bacterium]
MKFHKMHGLGNDFVLIDTIENRRVRSLNDSVLSNLAVQLSHRRFGIGADQVLLLYPSESADYRMRILNADGSEVEMCGNGIRCFAKYVWSKGYSRKKVLAIETPAGIIRPEKQGNLVRVDMGTPILDGEKIPVKLPGKVQNHPLTIRDTTFLMTCVSMGNPHAVVFVDDVSNFPVSTYGPLIETHELFPKKTNVEFIERINPREIRMRVWERGTGETMACGTGASAAVVASALNGHTGRDVLVHLTGGDLMIEWTADNHVFMTGPAVKSFEGVIEL